MTNSVNNPQKPVLLTRPASALRRGKRAWIALLILCSGAFCLSANGHSGLKDLLTPADKSSSTRKNVKRVGASKRFIRINDYLFNGKEEQTAIAGLNRDESNAASA